VTAMRQTGAEKDDALALIAQIWEEEDES